MRAHELAAEEQVSGAERRVDGVARDEVRVVGRGRPALRHVLWDTNVGCSKERRI